MELYHYGTPHYGTQSHSGRYPWDPTKHKSTSYADNMGLLEMIEVYKSEGKKTDKELAESFGWSVNEFKRNRGIALSEQHAALKKRAMRLRDHGYGPTEIGRLMGGVPEGTIRGWLKETEVSRKDRINNVADILEEKVKRGEIVDVGAGSELYMNVTKTTFDKSLKLLQDKGYVVNEIGVPQPNNPGNVTTVKYLAKEGTTRKEAYERRGEIITVTEFVSADGKSFMKTQNPTAVDLSRVKVIYTNEDGTGGAERDGMIGIRRNVKDLSLGAASYAQVRIQVSEDGVNKYFLKGMAIYDDSIPDGYDICVYSNKKESAGIEKALKPIKGGPEDPFGATIRAKGQSFYEDKDGNYVKDGVDHFVLDEKRKVSGERYSLSPINKLKEEGEWESGSKTLSSQFLSKQPLPLINKQLDLTYKNSYAEYDEIMSITNPLVKKKILKDFAEGCDKDAVELKAAALPRQTTKVIMPIPSLKDNEVYAPTYKNGENLVLIRYPYAGPFESPCLKVNNNNPEAKKYLANAVDAIGINSNVAAKMSGADYDGDFVVAIPVNDKVKVSFAESLKGLKGFNPSDAYPGYPGMKVMSEDQKGTQMGIVSNLITDMTLQNATEDEITRAVKHSMVVIDAPKHELNWKLSEKENRIEELKQKYQKNPGKNKKGYGGATTLLSRAGSEITVDEFQVVGTNGKRAYKPDAETGEWLKGNTERWYTTYKKDSNGKIVLDENNKPIPTGEKKATKKVTQMAYVRDARELVSEYNTPQELAYANYANKMKALANTARKEWIAIPTPKADPEARKVYADEVESLKAQLRIAKMNAPLERQAQLRANVKIKQLEKDDPDLFKRKDKVKKEKNKILNETRIEVGAGKRQIQISPREWEAIQARAISGSMLSDILDNADMDIVRNMATPKTQKTQSSAKVSRMKALSNSGHTIQEIAEIMNVSPSTVSKYIKME